MEENRTPHTDSAFVNQDWVDGFRDGYFGNRPSRSTNNYRLGYRAAQRELS